MGTASEAHGREEKLIWAFDREICRKESTWKT
jgi:hypothetical protein